MARVAARNAREPGTGWTPVTGRPGTRCRKGRLGAPFLLAPCTGIVTCFTVRESRSRAAPDAISPAWSCGHRVSGCTMNKAMRPPPGSANGAGTLPSAPSRTDRKKGPRTAREGLTRRPALPRATRGVGCMPTRGRSGSVAGSEGPMPFCKVLLGYPRESRRDDLERPLGCDPHALQLAGRDARAFTEHWRRSNRGCRCYARVGLLP